MCLRVRGRSGISRRRWYRSAVLGGLGVSANWRMLDPPIGISPSEPPPGCAPPAVFPPRPARRFTGTPSTISTVRSAAALVSQRRSWYQRCIVRTLGGRATPPPCRARNSAMTTRGSSPVRKRASASSRTDGQEYDPGRYGGVPPRSAARWAVSAALRRFVIQPCADHRRCRVSTKSRPPRCCWNSSDAWSGQSQTATPNPRATACARPRVRSAQIAQGSPFVATPRAL